MLRFQVDINILRQFYNKFTDWMSSIRLSIEVCFYATSSKIEPPEILKAENFLDCEYTVSFDRQGTDAINTTKYRNSQK